MVDGTRRDCGTSGTTRSTTWTRARRLPSPQLVGTPERATLDLNALADLGVELVGRWATVRDGRALFSGGLRNVFSLADLKLERLLNSFDDWARGNDSGDDVEPPERDRADAGPGIRAVAARPAQRRDLHRSSGPPVFGPTTAGSTSPWSTRRANCAMTVAMVDSPGMYALGLPVLRRRKSTFIHGIEADAREVVDHLSGYLGGTPLSTGAPRPGALSSQ